MSPEDREIHELVRRRWDDFRRETGWSQAKLAATMGVSNSTMNSFLQGRRVINRSMFARLESVIGTTTPAFTFDELDNLVQRFHDQNPNMILEYSIRPNPNQGATTNA